MDEALGAEPRRWRRWRRRWRPRHGELSAEAWARTLRNYLREQPRSEAMRLAASQGGRSPLEAPFPVLGFDSVKITTLHGRLRLALGVDVGAARRSRRKPGPAHRGDHRWPASPLGVRSPRRRRHIRRVVVTSNDAPRRRGGRPPPSMRRCPSSNAPMQMPRPGGRSAMAGAAAARGDPMGGHAARARTRGRTPAAAFARRSPRRAAHGEQAPPACSARRAAGRRPWSATRQHWGLRRRPRRTHVCRRCASTDRSSAPPTRCGRCRRCRRRAAAGACCSSSTCSSPTRRRLRADRGAHTRSTSAGAARARLHLAARCPHTPTAGTPPRRTAHEQRRREENCEQGGRATGGGRRAPPCPQYAHAAGWSPQRRDGRRSAHPGGRPRPSGRRCAAPPPSQGSTPTSVLFAAYVHVLAGWSASPHFTLNCAFFSR